MIIYDNQSLYGWGILFHAAGSALFDVRTLLPALLSAGLAAVVSNVEEIQTWLQPRMMSGSVVFSGIQFLVSLIVVNRVRDGSMRFIYTHEAYGKFNFGLQRLAIFFTCALDASENCIKNPAEIAQFRMRFLRWIRAVHVLALEEFRGFETPKYRMGTLLYTEEILLFRESRRAARVLRWMSKGYARGRALMAPSISTDLKMQALMDEVVALYGSISVISNEIYPFPLAQAALVCVIAYGLWSPLAFGVMLPRSYFLAPLLCFTSVWISYACNLAAQMLEWPLDGKENDIPLKYYSVRFVKEMGEIEFGFDCPLVSLIPLERVLRGDEQQQEEAKCDYVLPRERVQPTGRANTVEWLKRAELDLKQGARDRKQLRHRLKPLVGGGGVGPVARPQEYDTGISLTELRASGQFKVLL